MDTEKIKEEIEQKINEVAEQGIGMHNLDMIGKLVDIHKDLNNEDYWEVKKEVYENELQNSRRIWKKK